jgi:hypothetical protein
MLLLSNLFFRGCVFGRTFFFCLLAVFFVLFNDASASEAESLDTIAKSKEWEVLLHYDVGVFGNRSLVDDPEFFLDIKGKYDPSIELKALYKNIYVDKLRGEGSAVCTFPLRAEFLARSLGKSLDELNFNECTELQEFMKGVDPVSASIIFPFYHMNGPASMFGHTLVRFDSSLESKLVSTSVTYAADFNGRDDGITYAFKGVFGLYEGRTWIVPYHEKIREYDNMNQRDIWEYELLLNPEEVRRMALHTFEIRNIWSRYFFFDENCAYNLLFIIEAGRPEVDLTDGFFWVIPADTIYVLREKGLIGEAIFRPSQSTRMGEMLKQMDTEVHKYAVQSIKKKELIMGENLTNEQKVRLLDFWIDYTQLNNREKNVGHYSSELIGVLRQRAAIPMKINYPITTPEDPLNAHRPSKLTMSSGSRDGRFFGELRWRPALHTPDDNEVGFLQGSSLAFFDLTLRQEEEKGFYLKKLSFVDIYSLAPVTDLFSPTSWKVSFGLEHLYDEDSTAAFFNPGAGKVFKVGNGLLYGFFVTKLQATTAYDEGFSAGMGYEIGYTVSFDKAKLRLSNDIIRYGLGKDKTEGSVNVDWHYFISQNLSFSAGAKKDLYNERESEVYFSFGINH